METRAKLRDAEQEKFSTASVHLRVKCPVVYGYGKYDTATLGLARSRLQILAAGTVLHGPVPTPDPRKHPGSGSRKI